MYDQAQGEYLADKIATSLVQLLSSDKENSEHCIQAASILSSLSSRKSLLSIFAAQNSPPPFN